MRDNLVNSWAARPVKFQLKNLRVEILRDPGLGSIYPDFSKRNFLMHKQCKAVDITLLVTLVI